MMTAVSALWTGGDVVTPAKPPVASTKVAPRKAAPRSDALMEEYAKLADLVGIAHPDAKIEAFKQFLIAQDWGIFSLAEVVAYMDKKAAAESKEKAGWHWCPLRQMDHLTDVTFGTQGSAVSSVPPGFAHQVGLQTITRVAASDYYRGPSTQSSPYINSTLGTVTFPVAPSSGVYDKTIPLHALRKVAKIEQEFAHEEHVSFFVCDYAPAPHIEYPDPFLMAVIKNDKLATGVGRFIIDFWDEPGFGLDKQLS